ncbi:hypothetical protein [Parablautia intestinalis]|uniref:hypothetical protein n=1 Tax=Parablautia intestinalis TaxID=2320100 RepID=UPI003AB9ABF6
MYEEIKERVRQGRWEAEGSMYVEADCNPASGKCMRIPGKNTKKFWRRETI